MKAMRMTTLWQRGYNLVEMMIALTVLGLVIGGGLVPLQNRLQQAEIDSARQHLQEAEQAIYAYALSHKTPGRQLEYYDDIVYTLPANRPYLPCPDVTGDGLEDRTEIKLDHPLPDSALKDDGVCVQQKGMLPWRTLGVRQLDPWGNHLTYRVDKKFSSRLYGFDETFYADMFDYAKAIDYSSGDPRYQAYDSRNESGAVICDEYIDNSGSGGCPNVSFGNIEAGIFNDTTGEVLLGARPVSRYQFNNNAPPTGIIDGPAFVVLSHGRDGRGAINRDNICRRAPVIKTNLVESANAYYHAAHPFRDATKTFKCTVPDPANVVLYENQFVNYPIVDIVNSQVDSPDDILIWGGTKQLYGFLARQGAMSMQKLEYLQ